MQDKIKLLIAVGASITANCQACLKTAVVHAEGVGVDKNEILEAMAIGRVVRKGAFGKMDKFASTIAGNSVQVSEQDCPFGATEQDVREWVEQDDRCGCS
jgi:AhpD family alkylhydroperoxidase